MQEIKLHNGQYVWVHPQHRGSGGYVAQVMEQVKDVVKVIDLNNIKSHPDRRFVEPFWIQIGDEVPYRVNRPVERNFVKGFEVDYYGDFNIGFYHSFDINKGYGNRMGEGYSRRLIEFSYAEFPV